ncbi:hypothetical protein DRE_03789 [Drechslerella stenobrocha 248]|uniref:Uncharacterized protein n=1 Tax=Drechslerella stenobrocha 248 TaxID=1043628 RepID=W7I3R6_9PEZI|nr:hypothetical protein DRE_03789 [Drechslerella stenobrocha 248]
MEPAQALQTVIDNLRGHGALLTRADIEWAFVEGKNMQQIEQFIVQYLNTKSMLSLEEKEMQVPLSSLYVLHIYESLKSAALLPTGGPPLSSKAATDQHVADELAALELQNELLKQNISRLEDLKANHKAKTKIEDSHQSSLVQNREHLQRVYMSERDQNSAAIEDLETTFRACLADLQDASGKLNFTSSAMSEMTRSDDRLLARLQSMISDLILASESTGDTLISAATEYAEMLAILEEQIIKTRLDHTFLNSVLADEDIDDMEGQPYLDVQEFNDLVVEIPAVASMRAKEGLLQPILQHLVSDSKSKNGSIAQRCGYILNTLSLLDARNKEAEVEITNRNNMQYVSGRMQMLFELSMRDYHDAMQNSGRSASQTKPAAVAQPPAKDEGSYVENKIWRSLGISSSITGDSLKNEIAGQTSKLKSKEGLYDQLWRAHFRHVQEGSGVVGGMVDTVGDIANGGSGDALTNRDLQAVEKKVKAVSGEVGHLASLTNARDTSKITVIARLKEQEADRAGG